MTFSKTIVAAAALAASLGAQAAVSGSTLDPLATGSFLSLSSAGLSGGSVASLLGGTIYSADQEFADIPAGSVFENQFLAVGPRAGQPATLTFTSPVDYLSFLWGSPDTYNMFTVNSTGGSSQLFTVDSLGFSVRNGDQNSSQYVQFMGIGGSQITSVVFNNEPARDAFETANYSITPIPEPGTYALFLAGLGALAFMAKRRKRN